MFECIRSRIERQIEKLRRRFGQVEDLSLGEILSSELVAQVIREEVGAHRQRLFPPLVTLETFIGQVLSADHSCRAAVAPRVAQRVADGQAPGSSDTGGYCKARHRLPEALPMRLLQETGQRLEAQAEPSWQWQGRTVKLVDGTTVSMPDTPANPADYPQPPGQAPGVGFPQARVVGLIGVASGAVTAVGIGASQGTATGEHALWRPLLASLAPGEVLLGDRYYSSYWLLAPWQAQGVDGVFELHSRRDSGLLAGQKEARVVWSKPRQRPDWMEESTYQHLPATLTLRVLRSRQKVLVTTLLDTDHYARRAIGQLYAKRWRVEVDLRFIKAVMQMDILRGKTPSLVRKEIGVHLLAYNLIRTVIAQAAQRYVQTPRTVSFTAALQLLVAFQKQGLLDTDAASGDAYEALLQAISRHRIGKRPGRSEPRAVKRRPKGYPLLTKPRQQAREELVLDLQDA